MGRKQPIRFEALQAADASINQTTNISTVGSSDKASYHITFSAPNSGTFTVEVKNFEKDSWYELDFGVPLTITSEDDVTLNINQINFEFVRLNWVPSAGAGTMNANFFAAAEGA